MPISKLVQRVIHAYAHDPEGLTREECEDLGVTPWQAHEICSALDKEVGGWVNEEDVRNLSRSGLDKAFIDAIGGIDGGAALRERAKWLSDNIVTRWWRWDFNDSTRGDMMLELGSIGKAIRFPFTETIIDDNKLVAETIVPALIEELKNGNQKAFWAIDDIGPAAKDAVPALIPALEDDDFIVHNDAVNALSSIGHAAKNAVPALIEALMTEGSFSFAIEHALCDIGGLERAHVPALLEVLTNGPTPSPINAVNLLGEIGPEARDAVPALIAALNEGDVEDIDDENIEDLIDEDLRRGAAKALGLIGPATKDVVPALIEVLDYDGCPNVRYHAAAALGRIGPVSEDVVPALIDALNDPDGDVRGSAADALGDLGAAAKDAVPALLAALKKGDADIRYEAATSLREIGPEACSAVLREALKEYGIDTETDDSSD